MITFATLFFGFYWILATILGAIFLAQEGFITLVAIIMLAFGALAIFTKSRWAWTPTILCLLLMVAVEMLAPYEAMIEILGAIVFSGIATFMIKREIVAYIRRDAARPAHLGGPHLSPMIRNILMCL